MWLKVVKIGDISFKTGGFKRFQAQFPIFPMRNRYIPFKCPLYNFLRTFKRCTCFFPINDLKNPRSHKSWSEPSCRIHSGL